MWLSHTSFTMTVNSAAAHCTTWPADTAEHWQKHGWVTVADDKPKTTPKTDDN
jgi:hypothetical protein